MDSRATAWDVELANFDNPRDISSPGEAEPTDSNSKATAVPPRATAHLGSLPLLKGYPELAYAAAEGYVPLARVAYSLMC